MRVSLTVFVLYISHWLAIHGQEFSEHLWQNRLLVMVAEDPTFFEEQLSALASCTNDFSERRVLIYQVLPDSFRILTPDNLNWNRSGSLYHQLNHSQRGVNIILIGLDGKVKLKKHYPVSCTEIIHLIDQMPMRRSEIEKY